MIEKGDGTLPHGVSGDPGEPGAIKRVVLIDGCSGIQYGQGNVQYSVYRASLPSVALESSAEMARHLLSDGRQWSRDVFAHNAQASFAGLAGTGRSFGAATEALAGDTLVIVRNSRGVQVGDGNTQHNNFQIRITNVAVKAVQAGPAGASPAAVDQLCQHPSQAAAEAVAGQIAHAARDHLVLDLTAQVTREIGSPVISGQPAEIRGRTGVQAGGSARAHVTVVVEVTNMNVSRLTRDLLTEARRTRAAAHQPARPGFTGLPAGMGSAKRVRPARQEPADPLAAASARIDRAGPPSTGTGPARGPGISLFG